MTLRIYSDPHFSSAGCINLERRPFCSPDHMDDELEDKWNSVVKDDDITIINGDLQVNKGRSLAKILRRLKGEIWIVPGNHDTRFLYYYPYLVKIGEIDPAKVKIMPDILKVENAWRDRDLIMCHFPLDEWDGQFNIENPSIHMHGHIHIKWLHNKPFVPKQFRGVPNRLNITMGYLAFKTALPAELRWMPLTIDQVMNAFGYK